MPSLQEPHQWFGVRPCLAWGANSSWHLQRPQPQSFTRCMSRCGSQLSAFAVMYFSASPCASVQVMPVSFQRLVPGRLAAVQTEHHFILRKKVGGRSTLPIDSSPLAQPPLYPALCRTLPTWLDIPCGTFVFFPQTVDCFPLPVQCRINQLRLALTCFTNFKVHGISVDPFESWPQRKKGKREPGRGGRRGCV